MTVPMGSPTPRRPQTAAEREYELALAAGAWGVTPKPAVEQPVPPSDARHAYRITPHTPGCKVCGRERDDALHKPVPPSDESAEDVIDGALSDVQNARDVLSALDAAGYVVTRTDHLLAAFDAKAAERQAEMEAILRAESERVRQDEPALESGEYMIQGYLSALRWALRAIGRVDA